MQINPALYTLKNIWVNWFLGLVNLATGRVIPEKSCRVQKVLNVKWNSYFSVPTVLVKGLQRDRVNRRYIDNR